MLEIGSPVYVVAEFSAAHVQKSVAIPVWVKFLTPNMKCYWAACYSNANFGWAYGDIYMCFERKTASVMRNFYRAACNADAVLWWEFCPSVCPSHACIV